MKFNETRYYPGTITSPEFLEGCEVLVSATTFARSFFGIFLVLAVSEDKTKVKLEISKGNVLWVFVGDSKVVVQQS